MEWTWEIAVQDILIKLRHVVVQWMWMVLLAIAVQGQEAQVGTSSGDLIGRMADVIGLSEVSSSLGSTLVIQHGGSHQAKTVQRGDRREWILGSCKGRGFLAFVGIKNLKGTLRVFLNGDPRPAIEIESTILFQGQSTLFSGVFSGCSAGGYGMWFPVTFGSSAQVTIDADPGESEVVFRLNKIQPMQTFRMKDAVIGSFRAREALGKLGASATKMPLNVSTQGAFSTVKGATEMLKMAIGESRSVFAVSEEAGGVLTHFGLEDIGGFLNKETCQKLLVSVVADGISTVREVPVLDLLCAPQGRMQTEQFLSAATRDLGPHYRLSVPMPFAKTLSIVFKNASDAAMHGMALLVQTEKRKWSHRSRHLHVLSVANDPAHLHLKGRGELRGWMSRSGGECAIEFDGVRQSLAPSSMGSGTSQLSASHLLKSGVAYRNRWMLLDATTFSEGMKLLKGDGVTVAWVYLQPNASVTPKK